jgi:uncharacterized membrane protein
MFNNNLAGIFSQNRDNKATRPTTRPDMTPIDWLLEAVALLGILIFLGFVIYQYPRLPEVIPSHFNGAGLPDDYSSKSSIWLLTGIGVFLYAMLSLIVMIPHQFNYTVKITPENALRQYTLAMRLVRYLKAAIVWLFLYIGFATIRVVAKLDTGLGTWFLPVVLAGILVPVVIYLILANTRKNRP